MAGVVLRMLAVILPVGAVALIAAGWANITLPTWLHEAFASFALIGLGGLFAFFPSVVREMNLRGAPTNEAARERYFEVHSAEHYATVGRVIGAACLLGGLVIASALLLNL